MFNVYLAGSCEGVSLEERAGWREVCEEWLEKNCERLSAINPISFYDYGRSDHKSDAEVFRFDRRMVQNSKIVLVNLSNERNSVGTICEITMAYEKNVAIIGFYEDADLDETAMKMLFHPWIVEMCDRIETGTDAMKKALEYVRDYYD